MPCPRSRKVPLPDQAPVYVAVTPMELAVLERRGVPRQRILTLEDMRRMVAWADGHAIGVEQPAR